MWAPGEPAPDGYKIEYKYNKTEIIAGSTILGGSFLISTIVASTIIFSGPVAIIYAPAAGIPLIGTYPVAAVGALAGLPIGTVGALVGLGLLQDVGFGVLLHGLKARTAVGVVPDCSPARNEGWSLNVAPIVTPNMAGVSMGGAL